MLPALSPRPLILVADAVGEVVATGPEVTRFAIGDRVAAHFFSRWLDGEPGPHEEKYALGGPIDGGLAEFMILHEEGAVAPPQSLSDAEAACLPIAGLTAWFALVERGGLRAGETVLVQGTGGVSIFAIQIAAALGARVVVTSGSDAKLSRVKDLGAGDLINYKTTPAWDQMARDLTGGIGVDHVIDVVGGDNFNQAIEAARVGGHVASIGYLGGQMICKISLESLLFRRTRISGIAVGHRAAFEKLNRFVEDHGIKPVIDSTYPFAEAHAAFGHLRRGAFGKVVIDIDIRG